jgi:hypothetical protein
MCLFLIFISFFGEVFFKVLTNVLIVHVLAVEF